MTRMKNIVQRLALVLSLWSVFVELTHASVNPRINAPHPETIVMSTTGWSAMMQDYYTMVMRRILDLSVERYGAYTLEVASAEASLQRVRSEVASGQHIQIDFSSQVIDDESIRAKTKQIPLPIFNNTIGLRQLVVRKEDRSRFSSAMTTEDFLNLKAGQAAYWQDVDIYKHADIDVIEGLTYKNLFPMLSSQRFDYIPLSIMEAKNTLNECPNYLKQFEIASNIYIYYPMPFYINLTKRYTGLGERVNYGIKRFTETGELQKMFKAYFKEQFDGAIAENALIFIIDNPSLTQAENTESVQNLLGNYFPENSQVRLINTHETEKYSGIGF